MARRVLLVLAAAFALHAGVASAYVIAGQRWPWPTLSYYPAAYPRATDRAARVINRAGVGIHLRRASRLRAAVIVSWGGLACEGVADVGFQLFVPESMQLGRGCSRDLAMLTAIHEFGHILGLGHTVGRCARMNPAFDETGRPTFCPLRPPGYWLAHPLTADDLRGLRRLYHRSRA